MGTRIGQLFWFAKKHEAMTYLAQVPLPVGDNGDIRILRFESLPDIVELSRGGGDQEGAGTRGLSTAGRAQKQEKPRCTARTRCKNSEAGRQSSHMG